ncbi:MAG TPA: transglutaminase-like domain-containing protein [Solirubrobacteraceae bacterium]|nr:transglutaminase-like domain-containing protein [Solirubrobacteraceae bacterium]
MTPQLPSFAELAAAADPPLDALALALAAEFRDVDAGEALGRLDQLGTELAQAAAQTPATPLAQARACAHLLGGRYGFAGERTRYDHPDNSMLDVVLTTRRGLPILLSVVYAEVARRAGIPLAGVGLPGHFVVGHFGAGAPVLLDPFAGGATVTTEADPSLLRPWRAHEIAMRMLNNLLAAFQRRADLGAAIRAAELRVALPTEASLRPTLLAELRGLRARLN